MDFRRVVIFFAMIFSVIMFGPQPGVVGQTNQPESSPPCPEMSDSIIRLYQGFFLQAPSSDTFKDLTDQYRAGETSLPQIGDAIAASDDFADRYGEVSNEQFVSLSFRNVLEKDPTADERTTWASTLASGYSRGAFMLALTEAEGFVVRTGTTPPLAGYLRWFPAGTHWYCGDGPTSNIATPPLSGEELHADYLIRNNGPQDTSFAIHTLEGDTRNVTIATGSIPGHMTNYRWDGQFDGDGSYGTNLDVVVEPQVSWIIVFYPESIGESRLGWQIPW